MSNKVVVIGLDGMAWHLLSKLFEFGAMPTLKRITENSLRGVLESTIPPITPPAWTSIASGVNPGKHGIFDFTRVTKNYETRLITSQDVSYPRVHEMIAIKGLKSVCINQPLTYPLTKIKNTMIISDWIAPRICCHPKSLEKYKQKYAPYASEIRSLYKEHGYLSLIQENSSKRVDAVNLMMKQLNWDLFWVIFTEPDHIFHKHYEHILNGKKSAIKIFEKLDETIDQASKLSDLLVIVSDHGFFKYKYAIFPNCFLDSLGLISKTQMKVLMESLEDSFSDSQQYTHKFKLPEIIFNFLAMHPIRIIVKKIYKQVTGKKVKAQVPYVDPVNSKAFFMTSQGIHVKEEILIRVIKSNLRKLSGILQVLTREEAYTGPYVNKAPHILFTYDNGYITGSGRVMGKIISKRISYGHHPDGIIIVNGRGVKSRQIGRINNCDIVPTILNYLWLPYPNDTDGKHISGVPVREVKPKTYSYLNHWRLIKNIYSIKRKLAKKPFN